MTATKMLGGEGGGGGGAGEDRIHRQDSVVSLDSANVDLCRICHCDSTCGELISPCYCAGSMRYVHQSCIQHWVRASNNKACELCRCPYTMRTKLRPPWAWELIPLSPGGRTKVICSTLFHVIAISCVVWSLYVLLVRTIEEMSSNELEWQFYTKIVVELIGCVGATILLCVWGKSYLKMFQRWIDYNRTFVVVNATPPKALRISELTLSGSMAPSKGSGKPLSPARTPVSQHHAHIIVNPMPVEDDTDGGFLSRSRSMSTPPSLEDPEEALGVGTVQIYCVHKGSEDERVGDGEDVSALLLPPSSQKNGDVADV